MPYISMNTNVKLPQEKILELKAEVGRSLALIPGKNESQLRLLINEGQTMFYQGKDVPCMMVQVNCYGQAAKEALEPFVKEITDVIEKVAGVPAANVYLTIDGYPNWGVAGRYI